MDIPSHSDAMRGIWEISAADGRDAALFGDGPERMIDAFERFTTGRAMPGVALVELPLLGEPSYDVLVGGYGASIRAAGELEDGEQAAARAAISWAASLPNPNAVTLFFERDAAAEGNQRAGVHCRHRGNVALAEEFFAAIGEASRAPQYRALADRLPEGWVAEYAAIFPGRPGAKARMELQLEAEACDLIAESPAHLRECFDAVEFSAYDDAMLEHVSRLVGLVPVNNFQFDILPDGTLGDTFSIVSSFEETGADFHALFSDGGVIARVCEDYERMGAADERWRLVEGTLFARKRMVLYGRGPYQEIRFTVPDCAKAKWAGAKLLPAKFYLMMSAQVRGL